MQAQQVKIRKFRLATAPCLCNAYAFPHRAGSGFCTAPGLRPVSCGDCGYGHRTKDIYATGDGPDGYTCSPNCCPWEH